MLDLIGTGRPAGDILSRVVRFSLGGKTYVLPVRSIKANREWLATLNNQTAGILSGLESAGDNIPALFSLLANQVEPLIEILLSYDTAGVLPSKDEIETIEPDCSMDILAAVREVWRAANPLVVNAVEVTTAEAPTSDSLEPTSSPPQPTAGRRRKLKAV
jgi:hypothetical protein